MSGNPSKRLDSGAGPLQFAGVIKAIIFDIGNVLLHFDYNRAFEALGANSAKISPELIASLEPVNCDFEAGRISRSEFFQRIAEAIGYQGTEEEFIAAWQPIFTENRVMHELVARLRERFPLYLLSNVGEIHCEYILRTYPVFGAFSGGVYSYRVGCLKPALEIYEVAARQFGVNPEETLYLDDMPANVEGARKAGFHAVLYSHSEHEAFLGELERLGVL